MMRTWITLPALALVSVAFLAAGCQSSLMPTPVAFVGTDVDPIAETPAAAETTSTKVFYFTDRTPRPDSTSPATFYSNDRDWGLRLGYATVELARGMSWDELRAESVRDKRENKVHPRLVAVSEVGPLWLDIPTTVDAAAAENQEVARGFAEMVQRELDASELNEIFIFIHGFNTRFDDNCIIAAELHHYIGRQGVFMSYAWPSRGSVFAYSKDKAAARYSTRYLRLFLVYLAQNTTARRINLIAHSAGAPIAVTALHELCLMHFDEPPGSVRDKYRIGRLMLVAPDMDLGRFRNATHDELAGVPEHMSIYLSTRDKALNLSSWIYGFARLGQPLTELRENDLEFIKDHPSVTIVDVAAAEKEHGSFLGHSYFHNDPWVSSDVIMTLRHGSEAAVRGLAPIDGKPIWGFPEDYPARAREAARKLYGGEGPAGE
jgi:esterase/lipase superfamily enzyme